MKQNRRKFLVSSAAISLGAFTLPACRSFAPAPTATRSKLPWYRRTARWGQTNLTEADPADYNVEWWRAYWKRTRVQGLIVNAGGIVSYYPSAEPLQYRAARLGDRDLFGEIVAAARAEGLVVLARMDSNRAHANLYEAHPDWFTLDAAGKPRKAGDLFITCINSPYYDQYLPAILREVIQKYQPEGFADNSWSGLGRDDICFCENCQKRFQQKSGAALPTHKDWDNPSYREWILWNYARRLEVWDQNNRVTREAGGENCLWIGMNSGSILGQCQSFRDYRGICARAEMILLDHQARSENGDLAENANAGQLVHSLLGWDKLAPESMAMYQAGGPTFRKASRPEPEARLWMLEGIAGGLQPWWHHVGAVQDDRRQFHIAESVYRWHEANEEFLLHREPLAPIGLVWSQRNYDFYGRDRARELVELPWRGWGQALSRARIPWLPVHTEDIDSKAAGFSALILPNLGSLSDSEVQSVRQFVEKGGALIATGRTSLYDEWGRPRPDFALCQWLGCHYLALGRENERPREVTGETLHSYLRLSNTISPAGLEIQPLFDGLDDTDIFPFGGWLGDVIASESALVPLTYIPAFPVYPPETSWMREPRTKIPGLILNAKPQMGRTAFLVADLDRRFAMDNLPDHGQLLGNLARWALRDQLPLRLDGPGLIDCRLYRQQHRLILHLINLTNPGARRAPADPPIPIGPLTVRFRLGSGPHRRVRLLVSHDKPSTVTERGWLKVRLKSLLEHEVMVVD